MKEEGAGANSEMGEGGDIMEIKEKTEPLEFLIYMSNLMRKRCTATSALPILAI